MGSRLRRQSAAAMTANSALTVATAAAASGWHARRKSCDEITGAAAETLAVPAGRSKWRRKSSAGSTSSAIAIASIAAAAAAAAEDVRVKELLAWQASQELMQRFPYSLITFDKEGSSVWVIPFGQWDVRRLVQEHGELCPDLDRYVQQMFLRVRESPNNCRDPARGENAPTGQKSMIIVDLAGYSNRQMTHFQTVQKILHLAKMAVSLNLQPMLKRTLLVNCNFFYRAMWKFLAPVLGNLVTCIEMHGTSSNKWRPLIRNQIAQDHWHQLPVAYGGTMETP